MKIRMIYLRSILFTVVFYLYTLIVLIAFLPSLFISRDMALIMPTVWCKGNYILLRWLVGLRVDIKGLHHLPKKNGYIVAAKHQSAMETVLMHALIPHTVYVLKRSLLLIPIAGWYFLRTGCIAIDRSGGTTAMRKMFEVAERRFKEGYNVVIFPEGTRKKPRSETKYNPGVALLYEKCQVPVVPVALNTGYFWPKNSYKKFPGTATFEFLPPIQSGLEKREFMKQLQEKIEDACNALNP